MRSPINYPDNFIGKQSLSSWIILKYATRVPTFMYSVIKYL